MVAHFVFKGDEIRQDVLNKFWERIRRELELAEYTVENIEMPQIEGVVLTPERFGEAIKQLQTSPHIVDTSGIEWGDEGAGFISACTFPSDADQKWVILVSKGLRPLRFELKHELLHVWEALLKLEWGTLSRRFS